MTLSAAITHLPRAHDPACGADAMRAVPWATGDTAALIGNAAASSPYLATLTAREGAWLEAAFDDPDSALAAEYAAIADAAPDMLRGVLRAAKRRVALLVALADLGGAWPLDRVTGTLSDFADRAVSAALRAAIGHEIRRGKLPGQSGETPDDAGGMVVLAMGKMGAGELNYSSDIDLICLFDETRFDPADYLAARTAFVRATRAMTATLSEQNGDGYVFRTDLRLRPDPGVTPVCLAMEAAERYYESLGRTWERAAYVKARPAAGDLAAGERFLTALAPFVWRRHLDFATIRDAHDMRLRIRADKGGHGPIAVQGHDMKLGRGGIREIEFFTQTRQIIAGGREPELRVRGTVEGLRVLADSRWVPRDVADSLADHYRAHRAVEHRIQMIADAQTHAVPRSDEGFARLAALSGRDADEMRADIRRRLDAVHALTEDFFAPDDPAPVPRLPDALANSDVPARWPGYPALRSARAVAIFDRLKPDILRRLAATPRPDESLSAFDGFLAGLPAGVQLFSLFEAHPQLIDLLVDIVGTAPDLGRHLAHNPGVFDAVIGGDFFTAWPGRAALRASLQAALETEADYERKLDAARRWWREWHFHVGVHLLRGLMEAEEAGRAYADLAEATVSALWPAVQEQFAVKYGPPPGRGAVVLGMGSLGSGRLHARSDLDLIVVYDADGQEMSTGRKALPARSYYARLTQALITAMSAQTAEGRLYEIDLRLRPSGNQGPVATSLQAFRAYQESDAWTWEHLALTRARVVGGPDGLARDVEAFRTGLLARPRDPAEVLGAVAAMRARIRAAKGPGDPWDVKLGPGRMQDIELVSQAAALLSDRPARQVPRALSRAGFLAAPERDALRRAYALMWSVQIGARLVSDGALKPESLGEQGCAFIARLTGQPDTDALAAAVDAAAIEAAGIVDAALPEEDAHDGEG